MGHAGGSVNAALRAATNGFACGPATLGDARDWSWVGHVCTTNAARLGSLPRMGLVLLNTPLAEARLRRLWSPSEVRICADGGADRLLKVEGSFVPDVLVGDFDSVATATLQHYRQLGVEIRDLSHDQDSTDLQK